MRKTDAAYIAEIDAAVASIKTEPCYAAEDVFAWLRSKGTANELPKPEPTVLPKGR